MVSADYMVCSGDNCAHAQTCYRFQQFAVAAEKAHPRQVWQQPPNDPQEEPCEAYAEHRQQADS